MRLAALADAKADLGVAGSADDVLIGRLLDQASAAACDFVGYPLDFGRRTHRLCVSASGLRVLTIPFGALRGVVSLTTNGAPWQPEAYWIEPAGLIRATGSTLFSGDVLVTFDSGYHLADDAPAGIARDVPSAIEAAVIGLVRTMWHESRRDPSLRSETVPGVYSVSFATDREGAQAPAFSLLAPYRLPRVL